MNASLLILGLLFASIVSADAVPQNNVELVRQFMGANSPKLYQGSDELGNCRLFVYSQTNESDSQVWLEGTFQANGGAVLGFPIVFMLSSNSAQSRVDEFQLDETSFAAKVAYPAENEQSAETQMSVYVIKENGAISAVVYETMGMKRACQNLKRFL